MSSKTKRKRGSGDVDNVADAPPPKRHKGNQSKSKDTVYVFYILFVLLFYLFPPFFFSHFYPCALSKL